MKLEFEQTINIAIGCVMASYLEMDEKREVIETLRNIEGAIKSISDAVKSELIKQYEKEETDALLDKLETISYLFRDDEQ